MATKKTAALDLDAKLGKCRNRIYRIGVELEGGWRELPPGVELVHDGSVRFENNGARDIQNWRRQLIDLERYLAPGRRETYSPGDIKQLETQRTRLQKAIEDALAKIGTDVPTHIGELPGGPWELSEFPNWMRTYYPHFVNASCGMHVHLSFRQALTYQRLMDESYKETGLKYLKKWAEVEELPKDHPIWDRLAGKSVYCQDKFWPDLQASTKRKGHDQHATGHRYTHVNYCYDLHSTLEWRTLPMFNDVDQAIRAIRELIRITNAYVVVAGGRKREESFLASLNADENYIEEIIECV